MFEFGRPRGSRPWPRFTVTPALCGLCTMLLLTGLGLRHDVKAAAPDPSPRGTAEPSAKTPADLLPDGQPTEGRIQALLKRVEEQIGAGRTMSPPGDNAMGTWLQVVGLMQPTSETSVGLLSAFATRLRDAAAAAQTSGKVALAIDLSVFADQASEIVVRETAARYAAISARTTSTPPDHGTAPAASPSPPPPDAPASRATAGTAEQPPASSSVATTAPTVEPASATVRAEAPTPDSVRESASGQAQATDLAEPAEQVRPADQRQAASTEAADSGVESGNAAPPAEATRDGRTGSPAEAASTLTVAVASEAHREATAAPSAGPAPSAAPSPSPAPTADTTDSVLPKDMVELLVRRGDSMMALKDISAARKFYEFAAATGDGHAAEALARTYDPDFITRMGIRGIAPDPARAKFWYQRAINAGNTDAAARLQALNLGSSR